MSGFVVQWANLKSTVIVRGGNSYFFILGISDYDYILYG